MHEAQLHADKCFVTLTYADPAPVSLEYRDFQLFMKRLRAKFGKARFYCAGEYGEQFGRPHFHALIFGVDFPDKVYHGKSPAGFKLYRSATLESLWTHGFSSVGAVTFESAAYAARYIMKKITGNLAEDHYRVVDADGVVVDRVPEFNRMSLKPGIGARWVKKFQGDIEDGKVVVRGVKARAPRYYLNMLRDLAPEAMEVVDLAAHQEAVKRFPDQSDERLAVKEVVTHARVGLLKRKID